MPTANPLLNELAVKKLPKFGQKAAKIRSKTAKIRSKTAKKLGPFEVYM